MVLDIIMEDSTSPNLVYPASRGSYVRVVSSRQEILEGEPSNPKTPVKWLGKVSYGNGVKIDKHIK